jgi:hypothetical protein
MAGHLHFSISVRSEKNNVKLDVLFVRIHFAVAVHHLKISSNLGLHLLIRLYKCHCLVVGDTVQDGCGVKELPVNEQVEEKSAQNAAELVVTDLRHLAKLLLTFASHFVPHFIFCLVVIAIWTCLFSCSRHFGEGFFHCTNSLD